MNDSFKAMNALAWKHISAREFEQAEKVIRRQIAEANRGDAELMFSRFGLLASVLNSLQRFEEATEMLRLSLAEAEKTTSTAAVGAARYFLAYQYLLYGDPNHALAQSQPVPSGIGHSQCLLHSVAAQALWKLSRYDEARTTARNAIEAAPTEERRSELSAELAAILGAVQPIGV